MILADRRSAGSAFRCGILQVAFGLIVLVSLFGGTGCSTPAMKGTPFYSGLSAGQGDPSQERVNLWPLLYYREPTLSILWPFLEFSDRYLAVRPLLSVDGLGTPNKEYSVLWPIGSFNRETGDNRFFPFFWGSDYRVFFPLYWQSGHPVSEKRGYSTLFPLWWYSRYNDAYSFYAPWPLIHAKRRGASRGWHVFPLAGNYTWKDGHYRYQLFPIAQQYKSGADYWNTVAPFYFYSHTPQTKLFLSLPWSAGRTSLGTTGAQGMTREEFARWQLLLPLYFHASAPGARTFATLLGGYVRDGDEKSWLCLPLLGGSRSTAKSRDTWLLYPLIHSMTTTNTWTHHLLPLFYTAGDRNTKLIATPLGGYLREGEEKTWMFVPLLAKTTTSPDSREIWLLGPTIHSRSSPEGVSRQLLPLFYYGRDDESSCFLSLPWSYGKNSRGRRWQMMPPLYYRAKGPDGTTFLTPLWSQGTDSKTGSKWQALLPLFYAQQDAQERIFATLLGGLSTGPDGRRWLIYPLLSWGNRTSTGGRIWIAAPLARFAWGDRGSGSHIIPLYYWNKRSGTFVSPLWSRWRGEEDSRHSLIPPLLSWFSASPERRDLWCAWPLAHLSWGKESGSSHILPLFYRNPRTGTTVTPLMARWQNDAGRSHSLIPPLLSWFSASPERRDLWCLWPLAHFSWGKNSGSSHILPLFYRNPEKDSTLTPLLCTWRDPEYKSLTRVVPPLLSGYSRRGDQKDLWALGGIYHDRWTSAGRQASHLLPFYHWRRGDHFYTPLVGWRRGTQSHKYFLTPLVGGRGGKSTGFWFFPIIDYKRDAETGDLRSRFLWGYYNRYGDRTRSIFFPLFGYHNFGTHAAAETDRATGSWHTGKDFFCFPWCWYRNERFTTRTLNQQKEVLQTTRERKQNGIFPLWSYSRETLRPAPGAGEVKSSVASSFLLWLFDYERTVSTAQASSKPREVHTRSRILWYLWNYQRNNDDVSIDSFPGLTYDRTSDGYKKVSFLWRVFRYERLPDGARNMDLFFIPLMRRKGG